LERSEEVRVKRREEKEKHWEWKRCKEEQVKGMEAKRSGGFRWGEKGRGECYRGGRGAEKGRC